MNRTLKEIVTDGVNTKGSTSDLAKLANVSEPLVVKVKGGHIPKPRNAYRIALACDCSEQEARAYSQASEGAKTA